MNNTTVPTPPPPPTKDERLHAAVQKEMVGPQQRNQQQAQADDRRKRLKGLINLADLVNLWGWVVGLVGILGGIALMIQTESTGLFGSDVHPYIGAGIGVIIGAVILGMVLCLLGNFARCWVLERTEKVTR